MFSYCLECGEEVFPHLTLRDLHQTYDYYKCSCSYEWCEPYDDYWEEELIHTD